MVYHTKVRTVASEDLFERIDEYILLQIFNRLPDIKDLGRCSLVSKRFHSLVFLVQNVTMKVDRVIWGGDERRHTEWFVAVTQLLALSRSFNGGMLERTITSLLRQKTCRKNWITKASPFPSGDILKNFRAIQNLRLELPDADVEIEDGDLLKWRMEFGSLLHSCVILLAFHHEEGGPIVEEIAETDGGSLPKLCYSSYGWKLRRAYILSSLTAAYVRHLSVLQQIILEHPTLVSLVLTDADGQGELSMCKTQLEEFKSQPLSAFETRYISGFPALNVKLWYEPYLELPGKIALKGATLVAIRSSDQPVQNDHDVLASTAFEEPFKTAASLLIRGRTYLPQKK